MRIIECFYNTTTAGSGGSDSHHRTKNMIKPIPSQITITGDLTNSTISTMNGKLINPVGSSSST
jgi:hypothetical protein